MNGLKPYLMKTTANYHKWLTGGKRCLNPDHMKSNADVEFVISDEDMEALKNVEHIKDYGEYGFFPVFGGKM